VDIAASYCSDWCGSDDQRTSDDMSGDQKFSVCGSLLVAPTRATQWLVITRRLLPRSSVLSSSLRILSAARAFTAVVCKSVLWALDSEQRDINLVARARETRFAVSASSCTISRCAISRRGSYSFGRSKNKEKIIEMDTIRSWLVEHKLRAVGMFSSYPSISFYFLGKSSRGALVYAVSSRFSSVKE
jgi:hypothetical protein